MNADNQKLLQNKKALVFASFDGIGRGIAEGLIDSGATVFINSRSEDKLKEVSSEIGAAGYIVGDLTRSGEGERIVNCAIKEMSGLDILVTNTGGPPKGYFKDITDEEWLIGYQSLFLSVVGGIRAALPAMQKNRWGRIICITSTAGKEPILKLTVSNSIRAGLYGLINSLSKEVAAHGITINAVMPGYTETSRLAELGVNLDSLRQQIPAERLGTTKELASLVSYLSSDQAGFITGQAIAVDGGMLAGI